MRVSTTGQAERACARDGFSIPVQREANKRHAHSLGALVVAEFIERGASARSAARPELQRMLAYVAEHSVDYVIVHKLDRLARNRTDDVALTEQIRAAGARLVSTTEAISESPDGRLLHGIMAAIAEFYSHNLSREVTKGMRQKVTQGGTAGRAPLGYRNVRIRDEQGRDDATVEVDPERAEHITWAFVTYATGGISLAQLAAVLTARGLVPRPIPGREQTVLNARSLRKILTNPYYKGIVRFADIEAPGDHVPLIDPVTWSRVQDVLQARRSGTRSRVHHHPLKGLVRCYHCRRPLILHHAKSRSGTIYEYFVCPGRAAPEPCTQRAVQVIDVESRVETLWDRLDPDSIRKQVIDVATLQARRELEHLREQHRRAESDLTKATGMLDRLPELAAEGSVPADIVPTMRRRTQLQVQEARNRLESLTASMTKTEQLIDDIVERCESSPAVIYRGADPALRRQLAQAVFIEIRIGREPGQLNYQLG